MSSTRLNLAEKFLLLALDDEKGRFYATNSISMGYGLASAMLIVVALRREIQTDKEGNVQILERRSQEEALRRTLNLIDTSPLKSPIQHWISRIARNHLKNQQLILDDLCKKGILHQEHTNVRSSFDIKNYPTLDPAPERTLREEIINYVHQKETLKPSLYFLLVLIHTCGIFEEAFPEEHRVIAHEKLAEIEKGEIPSARLKPETAQLLQAIHSSLERLVN